MADLSKKQICELRYWALPRKLQLGWGGSDGDWRTIESLRRRGLLVPEPGEESLTPSTEGWRLLLALAEAGDPPWRS